MGSTQVPEGYKQTEVGVIPKDWELSSLGEITEYVKGFAFKAADFRLNGVRVIRVSDTTFDSIKDESEVFIDERKAKNFRKWALQESDLIISTVGSKPPMYDSMVGKATIVNKSNIGSLLNQNAVIIRSKDLTQSSQCFLHNNLRQLRYIDYIEKIFRGNANQASITLKELFDFLIPIPKNKEEQRSIAQALSDVDTLIAAQEKLIAKKRHLKTATMQQLLTGKVRLSGFTEKWEKRSFSEIASCRAERLDPRKTGVQEYCIELEHIESSTGRLLGNTRAGEQASLKGIFYPGDVLFGKLRPYLRKYWLANREGVCSTEIWVLITNNKLARSEFVYQIVKTDGFIELASTAYGTHMPRADWNIVKNFEVNIPPLEEQRSIATILSDMDTEITALETRRAKTQAIKQGMMQELLTGRTRLI